MKHLFSPLPSSIDKHLFDQPFKDPFLKQPHPLAVVASELLQIRLKKIELTEGKMMGVLVVKNSIGEVGYLSAFSGKLNGHWLHDGFVPPIFDIKQVENVLNQADIEIKEIQNRIIVLENSKKYRHLTHQLEALKVNYQLELKQLKFKLSEQKKRRHKSREHCKDHVILMELSLQSQADKRELKKFKSIYENNVALLKQSLEDQFFTPIQELKQKVKQLSQRAQKSVFSAYSLTNFLNKTSAIDEHFIHKLPPSGAGDCAAPKLLHFAAINAYTPLAIAEFWWGASPIKEIRHHGHFYPPCRSKCHKILPFMLQGIEYEKNVLSDNINKPSIIFEDDVLLILNKPEHMLSIPGIAELPNVYDWLKSKYPKTTGPLLVHRLDQETSGILVVAKTKEVHKYLQKQFINRSIKKRYVALLSSKLKQTKGRIELPLRVDLDDRPRQLVCDELGKSALTYYQLIRYEGNFSRVYFYPHTGRTHQLRLHAAHVRGLNNPIVGDKLYGTPNERMMLHAERIEFIHPTTGKRCYFKSKVPF